MIMRTCLITAVFAATAYCFGGPVAATAATGKCNTLQARCAVEIGGKCNPQTGHWCYGNTRTHGDCGRSGTPQGGLTTLFDDCISRGTAGHK